MYLKRIALILITVILTPLTARAGYLAPARLVRPTDTALRNRLSTTHLVRDEPFEVLALYQSSENASAADHLNAGIALSLTGRYILASEAFQRAVAESETGSEIYLKALLQLMKMSLYNPDIEVPTMKQMDPGSLDPELSLAFSGYFAEKGDRESALNILENTVFTDTRNKVLSGILKAGHLAAKDRWDASAKVLEKIKINESTPTTDLLYLMRGYHLLEGGQPDRAKSSFRAIPPSSPYASEALLGSAWSFIRTNDLQEATILLEELVEEYRYSQAAGDGVLDLAIAYRELGLFDQARTVLEQNLKRLKEVRNWLLEMREADLKAGSDIILLLEQVTDGSTPDRDLLQKTPSFVRQWIMDISVDPYVIQTTALLKSIRLLEQKAARTREKLGKERKLVREEIRWVNHDISSARSTLARLEEIRNQLLSIKEDMSSTLQSLSLNSFASEKARTLIRKIEELKVRLALMESSVSKAEGFTNLVGRLSESVAASKEENQLIRIRKQAYEGLVSSRLILGDLKTGLSGLEGQLWLEVKGEAIQLDKKTSLRVTSGRTRAGQASANTSKTIRLLTHRIQSLEKLDNHIIEGERRLGTTFPARLNALAEKIDQNRSTRLLSLAARTAQKIKNKEALTLYTFADIETSRMESTMRSLQEAVE